MVKIVLHCTLLGNYQTKLQNETDKNISNNSTENKFDPEQNLKNIYNHTKSPAYMVKITMSSIQSNVIKHGGKCRNSSTTKIATKLKKIISQSNL